MSSWSGEKIEFVTPLVNSTQTFKAEALILSIWWTTIEAEAPTTHFPNSHLEAQDKFTVQVSLSDWDWLVVGTTLPPGLQLSTAGLSSKSHGVELIFKASSKRSRVCALARDECWSSYKGFPVAQASGREPDLG